MNYRIIFFWLIICLNSKTFGQTENDIVGTYRFRGGDHFLKADKTFIIIGYGTLITGKWELKEKGIVLFTPEYEKQAFTFYGRHNRQLGDSSHIMVSYGFNDEETFLHFGNLDSAKPNMRRVFKEGHSCITFPYVIKTKLTLDSISFSFLPYVNNRPENYQPEIYTFYNNEKYNDFVAIHHMVDENDKPFTYLFKDNKLYYDDDTYGERKGFEKEFKEIEDMMNGDTDGVPTGSAVYFTPLYNECSYTILESMFKSNYKFDQQKNAYIDSLNYREGEERLEEYDFNKQNIIYKYDQLKNFIQIKRNFSINQLPIFIEKCD